MCRLHRQNSSPLLPARRERKCIPKVRPLQCVSGWRLSSSWGGKHPGAGRGRKLISCSPLMQTEGEGLSSPASPLLQLLTYLFSCPGSSGPSALGLPASEPYRSVRNGGFDISTHLSPKPRWQLFLLLEMQGWGWEAKNKSKIGMEGKEATGLIPAYQRWGPNGRRDLLALRPPGPLLCTDSCRSGREGKASPLLTPGVVCPLWYWKKINMLKIAALLLILASELGLEIPPLWVGCREGHIRIHCWGF